LPVLSSLCAPSLCSSPLQFVGVRRIFLFRLILATALVRQAQAASALFFFQYRERRESLQGGPLRPGKEAILDYITHKRDLSTKPALHQSCNRFQVSIHTAAGELHALAKHRSFLSSQTDQATTTTKESKARLRSLITCFLLPTRQSRRNDRR
jgi:hypothetical protein